MFAHCVSPPARVLEKIPAVCRRRRRVPLRGVRGVRDKRVRGHRRRANSLECANKTVLVRGSPGLRKLSCARTVPKPYSFVSLGLALSEKQNPQVVEKIEKPKEQIEGVESSIVLRRQAFSRAPIGKISKKWSNGLSKRSPFKKPERFAIPILRWPTLIFSRPI